MIARSKRESSARNKDAALSLIPFPSPISEFKLVPTVVSMTSRYEVSDKRLRFPVFISDFRRAAAYIVDTPTQASHFMS